MKTVKEKVKHIVNEDNDRVFDVIIPEDGSVKLKVKTGKGNGNQAFRTVRPDTALIQITEAMHR